MLVAERQNARPQNQFKGRRGKDKMAEFCEQCSLERGMPVPGDFAGLMSSREYVGSGGLGVEVLCEGCGLTRVDHTGACISSSCIGHPYSRGYLTNGGRGEKMIIRPVTEAERIILEKVARRRGIACLDCQYRVGFMEQGNFTIAVLKTIPVNLWNGEMLISLGVAKRNPIDADYRKRAEVLAMCRALENEYICIDEGY